MNHPLIDRIQTKDYPFSKRREVVGNDALGNEVFSGEEILFYQDEFFLVEELSEDAIEVLEMFGADYKIAK